MRVRTRLVKALAHHTMAIGLVSRGTREPLKEPRGSIEKGWSGKRWIYGPLPVTTFLLIQSVKVRDFRTKIIIAT